MKSSPLPALVQCPEKVSRSGDIKNCPRWWRAAFASLVLAGLALCANNASAQLNWLSADVGSPTLKGSVVTNSPGNFTVTGGGDDIWNASSNFHFYYAWASGQTWDAIVQVQNFVGPNTWSKVELLADAADPTVGPQGGDAFIASMQTQPTTAPPGGVSGQNLLGTAQYRTAAGAGANNAITGTGGTPNPPNTWLKLHRNGSVFSVEWSTDGVTWTDYSDIDTASTLNGFGQAFPDLMAVGVAVTAHDDANTAGAMATIANLSATFPIVTAPTVLNVTAQVTNTSAYAGCEASFTFVTTNNSSPNVVAAQYQWYKNDVAISNATGRSFTFLASTADNNAKVYCKATIPAPYNTTVTSVTSATGTVAVASSTLLANRVKTEFFYTTTSLSAVEAGNVAPASQVLVRTNVDDPGGHGNNYVSRTSGYFIPPASDNYVFFLAVDDSADLYLSTDSTPGNKQLIAHQDAWCPQDTWVAIDNAGVAGGGNPPTWGQKESDTFTPDGINLPGATGYALTAGQKYYFEVVHSQGGGGDNVGVTYEPYSQLYTDLNFTNGAPSKMTSISNNIATQTYPDTTPTWTLQPTNLVATALLPATFSAKADSGGEFPPNYQWYSNSVAIPGAIGSSYTIPSVATTANGQQYYAVATAYLSGLSSTSHVATLNVNLPVFEKGYTKVEYWYSITDKSLVENGTAGPPDHTITSPRFESTTANNEGGDNYVNRLSTLFTPTVSGNYVFYVNSDDDSDLFVSTDSTPGNKRLVAQEANWSNANQWQQDEGAANVLPAKSSATWLGTNATPPYAAGIPLTAGVQYYIEQDHHEGGGGDNASATWTLLGDPAPANGAISTFAGNVIGINVSRSFNAGITLNPVGQTVNAYSSVSFTAAGTNDATIAVGTTGDPRPLWTNTVAYQWYKNGVPVSGATAPTYTIASALPSDNGSTISCGTRGLGYSDDTGNTLWVTSSIVTLTVNSTVPVMNYAAFNTNGNWYYFTGFTSNLLTIGFSQPMDTNMLSQPSTYTVGGGVTVLGVIISSDNKSVALMLSGVPTYPLNVSVNPALSGLGGGLPVSNTTVAVNPTPLTDVDIGVQATDPAVPGLMYQTGTNAYTIVTEGSDIWNNADGFNFAYEMKTNDFDVVIREKSVTKTSNWAKGGLMVRETLDAGSRNWNIINDPSSADGIQAVDGSGTGANDVEPNARIATDGASAGWNFTSSPPPAFPNAWLRLKRAGDILSAYSSTNGTSWLLLATNNPAQVGDSNSLPAVVYVGICSTAHNNDTSYFTPPFIYENTVVYDNYNSSYVAPAGVPVLSASITGGNITITWTPNVGHLESSPALSGAGVNWSSAGTGGSVTVPVSPNNMFFRVVNP